MVSADLYNESGCFLENIEAENTRELFITLSRYIFYRGDKLIINTAETESD
jgi:hypothetical protein